MFKNIYKFKNLEEWLGTMGLVYIIVLAIITFFLIKFLVATTIDSYEPQKNSQPPFTTFEIDSAKNL